MKGYIGKRVLTGILIILVSVFLNFTLIHLAPGNPISLLSGQESPSPQMIAALQAKYGLNQPLLVQFISYLKALVKGDLGESILSNQPVLQIIGQRIGPTLFLSLSAAISSMIIGTGLGIYCARRTGSKFDIFISGISYLFDSMPPFWLGMVFILFFASWLQILPTSGMTDIRDDYTGIALYLDVLKHLVLPLMTLTLVSTPYFFRISRSSVIQVMSEDFITTLRATGMKESRIFNKYVLKNAILPVITVFGMTFAFVITGVAIIEIVFDWPGMGSLMLDAINRRDYTLLMGVYLILSISVAVTMIIVDVLYAFLDPRIRYQ